MLNIDQVKLLESKVLRAVDLIKKLSDEKEALKEELLAKNNRISELENLLLAFKDDQSKIEEKIINALNQLSAFEDSVYTEKNESVNASEVKTASLPKTQEVVEATGEEKQEPKVEKATEPEQNNLQKDLDDVLGTPPKEQEEINKQLDIF